MNEPLPSSTSCSNCGARLAGRYCHCCGQPLLASRWTTGKILREVTQQLADLESGWLHTFTTLLQRPASLVLDYWRGRTACYSRPFRYVFVCTAITVLLGFLLGIDDLMQQRFQPAELEERVGAALLAEADAQFDSWLNALVLLLVPVNALTSLLLFRKHRRTYGEHLILHCFTMGQLALFGAAGQLVLALRPELLTAFLIVNPLIGALYNAWVFTGVFGESRLLSMLKATVVTVVGLACYASLVAVASWIALQLA